MLELSSKEIIMTLQDLKKEKIVAMKAHDNDTVKGLNVVISLLMVQEKSGNGELTEADVNNAIRKAMKELKEEREGFIKANRAEEVESLTNQISAVEAYLPQQLTAEQIKEIILSLEDKSVPSVMRHFKANYSGIVDMKLVGEILKAL